jgi:hypothetical protein
VQQGAAGLKMQERVSLLSMTSAMLMLTCWASAGVLGKNRSDAHARRDDMAPAAKKIAGEPKLTRSFTQLQAEPQDVADFKKPHRAIPAAQKIAREPKLTLSA